MYVVTFYSYKGGVGRTMALVNTAALLAKAGKRVLVVDFDLEAPGLTSYAPFACADGLSGLVDYIEEYRRDMRAPKASDFIVACEFAGNPIWVLPAGASASPGYTDRLNKIDWAALYDDEGGFEMFEDLRNQWKAYDGVGFDYVLLDSRTGHTDVGGICTRQLPDAVIILFVPNKQNVTGLAPIVRGIRKAKRPDGQPIRVHLSPSNVPDQFDEDAVLGRTLTMADQHLDLRNRSSLAPPSTIIHHRTDLEILEDPIIVESRPKSKLSQEYGKLREALVSLNLEDREGAIITLSRIPAFYRRERTEGESLAVVEIATRVGEILIRHPKDGEIGILAAEAYQLIGEYELERLCLTTAIETGHMATRARLLRAVALISLDRRKEALDDIKQVLTSTEGTNFEFHPAVQLLRTFTDQVLPTARELFAAETTKLRAKLQLAPLLTQNEGSFDLVADTLLEEFRRSSLEEDRGLDAGNAAVLALIAAGRPQEAVQDVVEKYDSPHVALLFNAAMAKWMLAGSAPQEEFNTVASKLAMLNSRDANTLQCQAVAAAATGDVTTAESALEEAEKRVGPSTLTFSCWTYEYGPSGRFKQDIRAMKKMLRQKREIIPPIVSQWQKASALQSQKLCAKPVRKRNKPS